MPAEPCVVGVGCLATSATAWGIVCPCDPGSIGLRAVRSKGFCRSAPFCVVATDFYPCPEHGDARLRVYFSALVRQ
jgi:hypothetical protein